jgi:uncharacterized protein YbcI
MKSHGEIEIAVREGMGHFQRNFMGRGSEIDVHLIGFVLLIRRLGALTPAEQQMVQMLPPENGRDLLKQARKQLIETSRPMMEAMVRDATGVKVVSLHHDISTVTGEEVVLFTLDKSPCRQALDAS